MRSSVQRKLALLQCGLFTLALVGAHVHRATIGHGYCTDHGELIHTTGEEQRRGRALSRDHGAVIPYNHLESAHGCVILEYLAQIEGDERSRASAPRQRRAASDTPATIAAADHAAIPLLHQSPKNSPPLL